MSVGHPLVDEYLQFLTARARPNTRLAVAFDLKVFFSVVDKTPVRVTSADVMAFIGQQRSAGEKVVRIDGSAGLSPRTIRRRLSSVSGFYAYLLARDDTSLARNPVPQGLIFSSLTRYLDEEHPAEARTDAVSWSSTDRVAANPCRPMGSTRSCVTPARELICAWDLPRTAPHLPDPPAGSGHVARGPPGPGRPRLHRDHPRLPSPGRRLAGRRRTAGRGADTVEDNPRRGAAAGRDHGRVLGPDRRFHAALHSEGDRHGPADLRRVLLDHDPALAAVADVERSHIEAFKLWQWAQPGTSGRLKPATFRRRLGQLRTFFLRIMEGG